MPVSCALVRQPITEELGLAPFHSTSPNGPCLAQGIPSWPPHDWGNLRLSLRKKSINKLSSLTIQSFTLEAIEAISKL
jgi:hypothetical protein